MTRACVTLVLLLAACSGTVRAPDAGATDAAVADAPAADAPTPAVDAPAAPDAPPARARIDDLLALLETDDEGAIDAALHDVAWAEGWPLHEGARWLFATRWDGAPSSVSLVSDVNGWDTAAAPATRSPTGVHFFVVLEEASFAHPAAGAKYKWWAAPDVYRAPPEATAYDYDGFGEHGWVAPPVDAPHLERFPALASAHLEDRRTVRAWLPAGFVAGSAAAARARTLLLHDGQNVFDPGAFFGGWRADEALAAYDDVVAIAIDNAPDRMDAYTHTTDRVGGGLTGGRAGDYLALITDEVLPFARARWGVVARGRSLMIAGSSLGGLVSIWIAHADPELAGCFAGMSSTLGWGSMASSDGSTTLISTWSGHAAASIYLDSGGGAPSPCADLDGDGIRDDTDDADNHCVTRQMRDVLVAAGYAEGTDLAIAHAPDRPHNEAAWAERFPSVLTACSSMGWRSP